MLQHEKTTNRQNSAKRRTPTKGRRLSTTICSWVMVLVCNDKRSNKLSSAFSHKPMFVTDIRGTAVTAVDDNHRSGKILLVSRRYSIHCRALKKWVVEKSMSLLGQSCRQHRLQSSILRTRVSAMLRSSDGVVPPPVSTTTPREMPVQQRPQRSRCVPRRLDVYAFN